MTVNHPAVRKEEIRRILMGHKMRWRGRRRTDRYVISLCEIKYSENEFTIDKGYDQRLRTKREMFRTVAKIKKTVQITMITMYALKPNKYSSIVSSQVTMDDLFGWREGVSSRGRRLSWSDEKGTLYLPGAFVSSEPCSPVPFYGGGRIIQVRCPGS